MQILTLPAMPRQEMGGIKRNGLRYNQHLYLFSTHTTSPKEVLFL
jgi:hypothetical protein